nr:MAG TPA: hypothetical protein [Caudoviricetes sp.]
MTSGIGPLLKRNIAGRVKTWGKMMTAIAVITVCQSFPL